MLAFTRFVNRRGYPKEVSSDRGTHLVGSEYDLRSMTQSLPSIEERDEVKLHGVVWTFNPPYASNRGGIWERMIRSARRILSAIAKEQTCTDESLSTYLVEVENILNRRPLTPVSDDPSCIDVLTPNHLLRLNNLKQEPTETTNLRMTYTKQWRQSQLLAETFWKLWLKEYVSTLQLRQKWNKPCRY